MTLPAWVLEAVRRLEAPSTGRVVIILECYQGGVTKIELGGLVRIKPQNG